MCLSANISVSTFVVVMVTVFVKVEVFDATTEVRERQTGPNEEENSHNQTQ